MILPRLSLALLLPALLGACGDKSTGDDSAAGDGGAGETPCADPAYNPLVGTCAETFLADCFDPAGECDGSVDMSNGSTSFTWANGASVETSVDASVPTSPVVTSTLRASNGTVCAIGVTRSNYASCAAQTVYTRQADGAIQIWCSQNDGTLEVVCPGGEGIEITASQSAQANECGYGSDAGPCTLSGLGG